MNRAARLRAPLGASFEDRLSEGRAHRLWQRVEAARSRRRVVNGYVAGAVALASILVAVFSLYLFRSESSPHALRFAHGGEVPSTISVDVPTLLAFDDGSRVDMSGGARLDVLESSGRVFELALRRGTSEYEVHPGGPRTWRIECGGVTVEVVGTHFTVERAPALLRVSVTRGAVLVRGGRVPDGVVRLGPGQSIAVPLDDGTGAPSTTAPALADREAAVSRSSLDPARPQTTSPTERTRPVVNPTSAADPVSQESPASPATALDVLLAEADAARRASHFTDAARLLERASVEHAAEPRVAIVEFSLGRLYLDSLGDAVSAAAHFSRAVRDGRLPATLAEDALARLVEARARAGDSTGAAVAAARYRASYPAGHRAADVERWVSSAR